MRIFNCVKSVFAVPFLGMLLCASHVFAGPLDNWHWRNPLPNGNPPAPPPTLFGIVFTNGLFVAVGTSGMESISADATNWTVSQTATTNNLRALIYASGLFLAVGDNGAVETSPDGTNWVLRASGTSNSLAAAAYANGKYVAVGGSAVITSPDAVNWSSSVSGLSGANAVAGGSSGFVAVIGVWFGGQAAQAFFSTDGSTWTSQTLTAPGGAWSGLQNEIVTYADGAYLIASWRQATSMSCDEFIFRSTNGNTWAVTNMLNVLIPPYPEYTFFMDGNGMVVATGKDFLQFSSDGISWTTTFGLPNNYAQATAGAIGSGTYVIMAGPNYSYPLPPIFTSSDGLNWFNQQHSPAPPTGPTNNFTSIAFSNGVYVVAAASSIVRSSNGLSYAAVSSTPALSSVASLGGGFIGVGSGGAIYQSSDGVSWTQRNSATASNLHGIAAGNSLLVAVGDNGAIQTSPVGTIWTSRVSGTSLALNAVAWSNGLFVAVGQQGTVLTSTDGIAWAGQYSGLVTNLASVTYGSAGFAAVGGGGNIVTSPDGTNWTTQPSGTPANLESVTFGNGYYLAAGDGTVVLTSPDGATWTPRNLGLTGGQNLYGCAFLNGRFDVIGSGGTVLESDTVAPLFDLQIQPVPGGNKLVCFAAPGCNFRVQTCTNLATPAWVDVASYLNAPAIIQFTNTSPSSGQRFFRTISP